MADQPQLQKLLDVYTKSQMQSYESWLVAISTTRQADLLLQTFPKHTRTCFKRGVIQFVKKEGKVKLGRKWLEFEQMSGTTLSI